jgi:protein TonB
VQVPNPVYDQAAFQAGIEGLVAVEVVVDVGGNVAAARVLRSSGNLPLDESAVQAARRARFTPGWRNGKPVPVLVELRCFFTRKGPVFYTTVAMPAAGPRNIGSMPEPVSVPDPAVYDSVARLKLPVTVAVAARVDTSGSVTEANVVSSSGTPVVDRKARQCTLQAKFQPGIIWCRPA